MIEGLISHYVSFLAFIQIAVAVDFGFMYLERKSNAMRLSDLFYDGYITLITLFTTHATHAMRRVRKKSASVALLEEYNQLKNIKILVVNKTDDSQQLAFLKPMGIVAGIYSFIVLYLICMFDRNAYCEDLFLIISEITLIAMVGIFILIGLCKSKPYVLRYAFMYVLSVGLCVLFLHQGWVIGYVIDFERWYHFFILLPYLPVLLFLLYLVMMYFVRIPKILKMICLTRRLEKMLM